ncbi:hypothetical protein KJ608_01285, partial [Patescibacteria group bacterium]|nr:hypothetical protein [Patescibacteria group bacterium]
VGCIGRGGENLARFACLKFDDRAAGRTGTGWHFGYKKLKAIVVKRNQTMSQTANKPEVTELIKDLTKKRLEYEQSPDFLSHCTPIATNISSNSQTYPASNYRRNHLTAEELNSIGYKAFQKIVTKKSACWSCPLACTRYVKTSYRQEEIHGPEYESIWALGASCGNFDLNAISEAAYLCDDYGLDTISTGATIAWYKECVEKGLINDQPVTIEKELELIKLIGDRKGIGDVLAEGSIRAAEKFPGTPSNLAHAKGLELPAWDPRGTWGGILHYATCPTGGDHCKGLTLWAELADKSTALSTENKAALVISEQNQSAFRDSIGICMFAGDFLDNDSYIKSFEVLFNVELPANTPQEFGERIVQKEREINKKLGLTKENDSVPTRIMDYPMEIRDQTIAIGKENFEKMLTEYYRLRGWE